MKIRGHHLVCVYCFYGSGEKTAEAFFALKNAIPELLLKLRQNSEMEITVVANLDDVCDMCQLRKPNGCGRTSDTVRQNEKLCGWDRALLEVLGLHEGDRTKARELERSIRERIPDISKFCTNCTSASPSGWSEYKKAIREGLWPDKTKK